MIQNSIIFLNERMNRLYYKIKEQFYNNAIFIMRELIEKPIELMSKHACIH